MSKNILIVEGDTALSASLRQALEDRGFSVQETTDGKGSVELVRQQRPELVVLAVDLAAGQNGYLICGKLKKDEDLKTVPVIIIGNPDGFAAHRKLKAHADDYVAKPVDPQQLVEAVGNLIGFPELPAGEVLDEPLTFDGFGDEEATLSGTGEEQPVEGEELPAQDALDMLDSAFGDLSSESTTLSMEQPVEPPPEELQAGGDDELTALDGLGDAEDALDALGDDLGSDMEKTVVGFVPTTAPAPAAPMPPVPAATRPAPVPAASRPQPAAAPAASAADMAELRNLRARVAELQAALEEERQQRAGAESRAQELEGELEGRSTELETLRVSAAKGDSTLREAANRKEKELLRLRTELNQKTAELSQKDQEIVELRERQLELEQQAEGSTVELARKDAQLKTLTTKTEQLTAERKRMEQQLAAAREEARNATAQLSALQTEMENSQHLQAELEEARARADELDAALQQARAEADELRTQLEQERAELGTRAQQLEEEAEGLRRRVSELEETAVRNEDRVARLYSRVKGDEKLREKARKALAIAAQLLEEQPAGQGDEEAAA